MDPPTLVSYDHNEELLNAQTHIWTHIFSSFNSMALKSAIQLQIPDTIHKHGKPMTLRELATALSLHPTKSASLYRITRLLVHSNFLTKSKLVNGEETLDLTINSKLLLKDHPMSLAPFALAMLDPTLTEPAHHLSSWFRNDDVSPFHTLHGCGIWEFARTDPRFNDYFNKAMTSDAKFVGDILMGDDVFKGLFKGVESMVDVAGGTGTLAKAIASNYPSVKCTVLDLPHVVEGLKDNGLNLDFVGGDMFQFIPSADAVLLKWILHDWSDDDCLKILKRCKEAIPCKDEGGKVIIIDIVLDLQNDNINNAQLLFDMEMLSDTIGGKERTEEEWNQLFIKAGYDHCQIFPILGSRSVIVVYPS
ncbi:trans-resveratrol di-O-methyltransferase-like [Silene latifolia]|uniref:trans-resveratrol di-O-methyltransferase-like n=1 Tax=Silene latifolia TaxID=37657 RepID=UPI003D7752D3